jgi:hypothetical protein
MNTGLYPILIEASNKTSTIPMHLSTGWIVGFIEAECTFGIKSGKPYFLLTQSESDDLSLRIIITFIQNLISNNVLIYPYNIPITPKFQNQRDTRSANPVSLYTAMALDGLYYFILPLIYNLPMFARKRIDFKL